MENRKIEWRVKDREGDIIALNGGGNVPMKLSCAATIRLAVDTLRAGKRGTVLEIERQRIADNGRGTGWLLWRRYSIDRDGTTIRSSGATPRTAV